MTVGVGLIIVIAMAAGSAVKEVDNATHNGSCEQLASLTDRYTWPMTQAKSRVPAVDGWFTLDETDPRLLGTRCVSCGTFCFPRNSFFCRNPECEGTEFDELPLSRRGRVWSYTTNRYQPPPPYLAADPFEPYGIAAVELKEEKMVVLGQVADDSAGLHIGDEVEVTLGTLFEDEAHEYIVWKWRRV